MPYTFTTCTINRGKTLNEQGLSVFAGVLSSQQQIFDLLSTFQSILARNVTHFAQKGVFLKLISRGKIISN